MHKLSPRPGAERIATSGRDLRRKEDPDGASEGSAKECAARALEEAASGAGPQEGRPGGPGAGAPADGRHQPLCFPKNSCIRTTATSTCSSSSYSET